MRARLGRSAPSRQWQHTIDVNLTSAFLGAKHQAPAIVERGGGAILFTSSFVGASTAFPGMAAYAAAKAGLTGLVRVLAVEFGASRVRVNAIVPGGVDTPANVVNSPGATPATRAFIESLHALKRLATPDEIARSMLYLVSDDASFVTGAAIAVDGGLAITRT
jgi:NAD(P)-dependent dehydrogenase (short-subunit alcohol dehydrogenase family)